MNDSPSGRPFRIIANINSKQENPVWCQGCYLRLMKRNLLHPAANEMVLARMAKLSPDSAARWGVMDAVSMLRHCRIVAETILSRNSPEESPTLRQLLLRMFILKVLRRMPQGRPQPKVISDAMASQPTLSFEQERRQLIDITGRFANYKGVISGRHPVFGPMKTVSWGAFAWLHLDHHLRQFGV